MAQVLRRRGRSGGRGQRPSERGQVRWLLIEEAGHTMAHVMLRRHRRAGRQRQRPVTDGGEQTGVATMIRTETWIGRR
jgi:hypothetical protein